MIWFGRYRSPMQNGARIDCVCVCFRSDQEGRLPTIGKTDCYQESDGKLAVTSASNSSGEAISLLCCCTKDCGVEAPADPCAGTAGEICCSGGSKLAVTRASNSRLDETLLSHLNSERPG